MIRYHSHQQRSLGEFDWPFQTALDKNNRWVKMSQCIPWDELAEGYYQRLSSSHGRPLKDARLAIGAVIIKHKEHFSTQSFEVIASGLNFSYPASLLIYRYRDMHGHFIGIFAGGHGH